MDHQYSSYIWNEESSDTMNKEIIELDIESVTDANIHVPEKMGDDYLIELYRERRFLYDKKNRDFKNNEIKNNAWKEMSLIMTKDKNLGNHYTAEYCKKRITTLRERYVKLKKEQNLKSGSASCNKKKSSLLSQLSFLDEYIQRRRTLTNVKENENAQMSTLNKNAAVCQKIKVAEISNSNKKESEKSSSTQDNTEYDSTEDPTFYQKPHKIIKNSPAKKSNENDDTLRDLTNAIINICTQLQSNSTTHGNIVSKSAEQAFAEFVAFSLQEMKEPERSIRRNKIFQDLTTPLDQLL
ncbi:uncharacterized protein [Polyergus mexicanus]|uniref:uncharacterized protein isoform X1 n=2 Tax=Polyergus mexicanus TaxID=615972 RepID=UPI0038B5DA3C